VTLHLVTSRVVLSSIELVTVENIVVAIEWLDRLCGLVPEFLATDPEVRVRFPSLPDFLRSSGSGTGTQPREYN
jgi:hypothetical protein